MITGYDHIDSISQIEGGHGSGNAWVSAQPAGWRLEHDGNGYRVVYNNNVLGYAATVTEGFQSIMAVHNRKADGELAESARHWVEFYNAHPDTLAAAKAGTPMTVKSIYANYERNKNK